MSKKLYFLISFVLVLGLSSAAQAAPIDVNNHSFEIANDGNRVPGHSGYGSIKAWMENYPSGADMPWVGVDVFCPYASSAHCHNWTGPTEDGNGIDVVYSYLQNTVVSGQSSNAYMVLDMNNSDANAIISVGRQYTLTYAAMGWEGDQHTGELFYIDDTNFPDANHHTLASRTYALEYIERPLSDCNAESPFGPATVGDNSECPDWNYDLKVVFVAETGSPALGKTLVIKVTALEPGGYTFVDNFRVDWDYATYAFNPYPADGEKYVDRKVVLNWKPGTYTQDVNGHHVYFGTDETEVENANTSTAVIYRGVQDLDVNNYNTNDYYLNVLGDSNGLVLGKTYYWRIDEVNAAYDAGWQPGDEPPQGPWKGDVWSFIVEGKAINVYPSDGAVDVPFLDLSLEWTAGTGAGGHDVYFGSDRTAVTDANTNTAGVYKGPTQILTDVDWLVPNEDVVIGNTYYWRIDEVNATTVTGDVWGFTVGPFLVVDDMDSYYGVAGHEIYETWGDYRVNSTGAQVSLWLSTSDVNFVRDGNSMKFYYRNTIKIGKYVGSKIEALTTDLEFGSDGDWTAGGVKSLSLWFYGDPCNIHDGQDPCELDQMYVALETIPGSYVVSIYKQDMYNIQEASWHEWVIPLEDFNGVVDLSNVTKVYLGFGGFYETGQSSGKGAGYGGFGDTVFFDDIRVYPPRCMPGYEAVTDFTGDCITDYLDVDIMADEWLISDYEAEAEPPKGTPIIEYLFDEGTGSTFTANTGSYGPSYNITLAEYVDTNGDIFVHPNHAPLWADSGDPCLGLCLEFDGEGGMWPGWMESKTEYGVGGDYLMFPSLNLTSDTVTITGWIKPDPTFGKTGQEFKSGFTGMVTTRFHDTINNVTTSTNAAGLNFGGGSGFNYDGMLGYTWNDNASETWNWDSDIFPTNLEWNFVAVAIAPGNARVYCVDDSKVLQTAMNPIAHDAVPLTARWMIGGDISHDRFFKGHMDDIRIYAYTLSTGEIMNLAGVTGIAYIPNAAVSNLVIRDPDPAADANFYPNNPDIVNFSDYSILADNWLLEILWPLEE